MAMMTSDWMQVSAALRGGDLEGAVKIARGCEDIECLYMLNEIWHARPKRFDYLALEDLEVVRIAAAAAWLCREVDEHKKLYPSNSDWRYAFTVRAAVNNFLSSCLCHKNIRLWLENGWIEKVRIINYDKNCCEPCRLAALRVHKIDSAPELPIANCTNTRDGCRCRLIAEPDISLHRP